MTSVPVAKRLASLEGHLDGPMGVASVEDPGFDLRIHDYSVLEQTLFPPSGPHPDRGTDHWGLAFGQLIDHRPRGVILWIESQEDVHINPYWSYCMFYTS